MRVPLLLVISACLVSACTRDEPPQAAKTETQAELPPLDLTIVELEVPDLGAFVTKHPWCARKPTGRKMRFEPDGGFILEDPKAGGARRARWQLVGEKVQLSESDGGLRPLDIQAGTVDGKLFAAVDGELFSACP